MSSDLPEAGSSDSTDDDHGPKPSRPASNLDENEWNERGETRTHRVSDRWSIETEPPRVRGVVEEYDDRPNEYTICRVGDREIALTTWISASEGSYCSLTDTR